MTFQQRLISELTQLDMRESKHRGYNIWALGHYLKAADDVVELLKGNSGRVSEELAFSSCFTPCRGMHTVARRLGLKLDVQRGRWVQPE